MNTELARKLREMAERDLQLRQKLFETGELPSEEYHPQMRALHESNTAALKETIKKYGWPGISLVGTNGAKSAWLIAQHAVSDTKFMSDCIELLKIAVASGEVEGWQLAFLEDRVRTINIYRIKSRVIISISVMFCFLLFSSEGFALSISFLNSRGIWQHKKTLPQI